MDFSAASILVSAGLIQPFTQSSSSFLSYLIEKPSLKLLHEAPKKNERKVKKDGKTIVFTWKETRMGRENLEFDREFDGDFE